MKSKCDFLRIAAAFCFIGLALVIFLGMGKPCFFSVVSVPVIALHIIGSILIAVGLFWMKPSMAVLGSVIMLEPWLLFMLDCLKALSSYCGGDSIVGVIAEAFWRWLFILLLVIQVEVILMIRVFVSKKNQALRGLKASVIPLLGAVIILRTTNYWDFAAWCEFFVFLLWAAGLILAGLSAQWREKENDATDAMNKKPGTKLRYTDEERIAEFKRQLDAGNITQEQFDEKKKQILERY